ncbi:MAG: UDP-3-O-acyl-N-acetylglucosamine deacetylase [Fibrobacterales bacterium]
MSPIILQGIGVHSGTPTSLSISHSNKEAGHTLIHNESGIHYSLSHTAPTIADCARATSLSIAPDITIGTIEHLSAALAFFSNHNLEITLFGDEVPIFDGSATPIIEALSKHYTPLSTLEHYNVPLSWQHSWQGSTTGSISVVPATHFSLSYTLDSADFQQTYVVDHTTPFIQDILSARTYINYSLLSAQKSDTLLAGAIDGSGIAYEKKGDDIIIVSGAPLRFPDEFVRHKILDFLGDIFLITPKLPTLEITINNGGHWLTHQLIKRIVSLCHF